MIKKFAIHKLISLLKKELSFTINNLEITFVNSAEIIRLNRKYLNHIHSTDIITFDYSNSNSVLEGEILISFDDALNNSKRYKTPITKELLRLLIHGVLHLLGYNDVKNIERRAMKAKENLLLKKYMFLVQER